MSVILNALRAKEAARAHRPNTRAAEGLFVAGDEFRTKKNSTRLIVLLVALFVSMMFALVQLSTLFFAIPAAVEAVPKVPQKVVAAVAPVLTAQMAKALYSEGRVNEALAAFEKIIKARPNDALAINDMSLILMKQDRILEAEGHLREAIKIDANCAECYNSLGLIATQKGHAVEAERHFVRAMDLKESYAEPYFNLAVLFEKTGNEAGAIAHFEDFLKHTADKNSPVALQVRKHLAKLSS